jgi:tRNA uridine 5-carboxymethylaminomethyl modification enzyme
MTIQLGDDPIIPFSFMTDRALQNTHPCYLTWTNEQTHDIIRANLHRSPMFSGEIKGTGARYCPSIEDKVYRFSDKDRHQIFLEPESACSKEWYVQGLSSSLPADVQWAMYHTVPGLEKAELTRLAYAIEYDCIDPLALQPTLATHDIEGLFMAGQINGTSGYEEAAAQGLLAGINAVQYIHNQEPLLITRDQAYIGVLTDDLTGKGTDEPYRMMTSRAEHRLFLRQDNADLRLTEIGRAYGLVSDERMRRMETKKQQTEEILRHLTDTRQDIHIRRGEKTVSDLCADRGYTQGALEQAQIQIRYQGYLEKEAAAIRRAKAMDNRRLAHDIPYESIESIRIEARQKLAKQKPMTLGQAGRIPGVSPADIAVLTVWLHKNGK